MTTLLSRRSRIGALPRASSLPLSLLALADRLTLSRDYAHLLKEPPEQNRWFVTRGTEALPRTASGWRLGPPQRFQEVLSRLSRGEGPLAVLREADADQNPAPWHTLEFQASVSNRATALAVVIGFWTVVVFLGWVVVAVLAQGEHSALWESAYAIGAVSLVVWLSLPGKAEMQG